MIPPRIFDVRRKQQEAEKVVINKSSRLIAWQCGVHLLPISTTIAILWINFQGFYIGVDFPGLTSSDTTVLMLLQLSAKIHEIMIVASLSQIILHIVRHELLYGDGVPLGLIGSGLSFSNFEFYFRKDFYGSLAYLCCSKKRMKRTGFVLLLIVSGITAIIAGPASAVLLVPKPQAYPAGQTDFYLNGTSGQFWPEDLSGDMPELTALCSPSVSALRDVCPAGGYSSLWQRWSGINYKDLLGNDIPTFAKDLSGSRFYWPVHSPASRVPPLYALGDPRSANESIQPYTWLVQAHAASSILLEQVTKDWWKAVLASMDVVPSQVDDRSIRASALSAFAAVRCTGPQNLSTESKSMYFPAVERRWDWGENLEFDVGGVLNASSSSNLRFRWVQLPDRFGTVSSGAIVELPWVKHGDSRIVVGCSAQTGWVPTTLRTDSYTFWSGWYPYGIFFGERSPRWTPPSADQVLSPTNGRIAIGDIWLDMLTPPAPPVPGMNISWPASTIEAILASAGAGSLSENQDHAIQTEEWEKEDRATGGGRRRLLEAIISSVLADGLSRSGSHRVFTMPENESDNAIAMYQPRHDFNQQILRGRSALEVPAGDASTYTVLRSSMQLSGYAFRASLPKYLATTVLLAHAVLASFHMLWLIIRRRVSRSWDSIAELLALAQNSHPPDKALQNTGGGISHLRTYATIANIRIRSRPENSDRGHVELIFEEPVGQAGENILPNNEIEPVVLEDLHEMLGESSGAQTSMQSSWTFPVDSRKAQLNQTINLHGHSESTDNLIPRRRAKIEEASLVRIGIAYS
ncbi:hypothetical protein OHC33_011217 [Knufia fluminis]|uniref:Uncharacterized protein n=1 Tax=Knufia fluminis TaxID=191047 RepID=A0AAN8E7A7_9EURO|nr:hypothetical protein OHC33_011217 [Knufia fluminis]